MSDRRFRDWLICSLLRSLFRRAPAPPPIEPPRLTRPRSIGLSAAFDQRTAAWATLTLHALRHEIDDAAELATTAGDRWMLATMRATCARLASADRAPRLGPESEPELRGLLAAASGVWR